MLLKLEGAIPLDSSQFQDADPHGRDGVSKFLNLKLSDVHTLSRITQGKPWEFPMAEVKAKLAANIQVGVYLNPANSPAHGWLVDEIRTNAEGAEEIVLVSKYSENGQGSGKITAVKIVLASDRTLRWSDPIYADKWVAPPAATQS